MDVQRFRGGLVFKANRRCVSLNSRLERDKKEGGEGGPGLLLGGPARGRGVRPP